MFNNGEKSITKREREREREREIISGNLENCIIQAQRAIHNTELLFIEPRNT